MVTTVITAPDWTFGLDTEAVMASIKNNFELDIPNEVISMASGFPVGQIGRASCRERVSSPV